MSLPPDLNKTYERILEAVDRSQKSVQQLVKATLQWIVHSVTPLLINALCEAISLKSGDTTLESEGIYDEEDILLHCSSLIRRSAEGSHFELAHVTVKEFLEGISPDSPFTSYSQTESYVYPQLATTCLTYVNLDVFKDDVVKNCYEWDAQQTERPSRQHAVSNWLGYMKYSWEKEDVLALARRLFNPSKTVTFLAWTRDYFLFDMEWELGDDDSSVTITNAVYTGGVTPLHIAAAAGCPGLCGWLLQSLDHLNQNSEFGTPIHCALIGLPGLLASFNFDDWLYLQADIKFNVEGRSEILNTLIQERSDLSASFKDYHGQELSCSMLALYANMGRGRGHPLISLVASGCKLDQGLLTSFEKSLDADVVKESMIDIEHRDEFLDGLVEALKASSNDKDIKADLLNLALRSRTSRALQLIRSNEDSSSLEPEKVRDLFYRTIRFDQIEVTEDLLHNRQADLSFMFGGDDSTPLHIAVKYESINATRLLLSMGASVEAITTKGLTPLHVAVQLSTRNSGCILALLDHGASFAATEPVFGRNVWHMAVGFADAHVLKLLMERNDKDITALTSPDAEGLNPLLYAASLEREEAFESFLAHTPAILISQKCSKGMGLLHYVVGMNSINALELLDEKGVMFDDSTEGGENALHFLPADVSFDVVRFLIEKGVNPSSYDVDGLTPLHKFVREEISNDTKVLELLATEEALSKMTEDGYTPLHYAIRFLSSRDGSYSYVVRKDYISALIGMGADINLRTSSGTSAIKLAFECFGNIGSIKAQRAPQNFFPQPKMNPGFRFLDPMFLDLLESITQAVTSQSILNELSTWWPALISRPCSLISWAISTSRDNLAQILLSKAVDLDADLPENGSGDFERSALQRACLSGSNETLFRQLLSLSQKKHECDRSGFYLAHLACFPGSRSEIYHLKALSEAGVDICKQQTAVKGKHFLGQRPLMLAAAKRSAALTAFLLDSGSDVTIEDAKGWKALHYAINSGDISVVRAFTGSNSDWNSTISCNIQRTILGCNALHQAVLRQSVDIVRHILKSSLICDIVAESDSDLLTILLAKDAAAGSPSYRGPVTPMHIAIAYNNLSAVKTLLKYAREQGHLTETQDQTHLPLNSTTNREFAQRCDQKTLAMWQIDYPMFDKSVCIPSTWNLEWLLYYNDETKESHTTETIPMTPISGLQLTAFLGNRKNIAEVLLTNGADINFLNPERYSALHFAAWCKLIETLDFLIRQGANINARDDFGITPVMLAAKAGSVEALKSLSKSGASMNVCDESGQTAFHYASSRSPSAFSFLFFENQDPYKKDYYGDSAVMVAIDSLNSQPAFLSLLCNLSIDFGRCSELIARFPRMSRQSVRLLLRRFSECVVSSEIRRVGKGNVRGSILNQAVRRDRVDLLEMLIKAGESIESEQGDGCSPLLDACSYGREDVMKYLTRAGASIFGTKDGNVCSALHAAKPFPQMVQWLLVGRHSDQKKLTVTDTSRDQSKIRYWSGPMTAEVVIKDFYELTAGASSRRQARELSRLNRNLRGSVVVVRRLR